MNKIPAMTDMKREPQEKGKDYPSVMAEASEYPYGLCISLCNDELEKLDLDTDDVGIGDMLHLHCLAKVTCVSKNDSAGGCNMRIELQITHISAESEDEENEEEDEEEKDEKVPMRKKMYNG